MSIIRPSASSTRFALAITSSISISSSLPGATKIRTLLSFILSSASCIQRSTVLHICSVKRVWTFCGSFSSSATSVDVMRTG